LLPALPALTSCGPSPRPSTCSYLGWQIRLSDDDDTIIKAKDMHPKLAIGMTVFFFLGGPLGPGSWPKRLGPGCAADAQQAAASATQPPRRRWLQRLAAAADGAVCPAAPQARQAVRCR
jgi:hypothetical protein